MLQAFFKSRVLVLWSKSSLACLLLCLLGSFPCSNTQDGSPPILRILVHPHPEFRHTFFKSLSDPAVHCRGVCTGYAWGIVQTENEYLRPFDRETASATCKRKTTSAYETTRGWCGEIHRRNRNHRHLSKGNAGLEIGSQRGRGEKIK